MYKYLDYEKLKGIVIAEKDGVLLKAFQKCIIFYTSESLVRVSVGACKEVKGIKKLTEAEKNTILELTERYFPALKDKVIEAITIKKRERNIKNFKNSPIGKLLVQPVEVLNGSLLG